MVAQINYFPEMFANLYHTAELSGKIDETLLRLHNYYEEEGFRTLQLFTRILNGIIYGSMAMLVGDQRHSFLDAVIMATCCQTHLIFS